MHGRDADACVPYVYAKPFPDLHPADDDAPRGGVFDRIRYEIGQCPLEQGVVTFNGWRVAPTHADSEFDASRPCRFKVLLEDFCQHGLRIDR